VDGSALFPRLTPIVRHLASSTRLRRSGSSLGTWGAWAQGRARRGTAPRTPPTLPDPQLVQASGSLPGRRGDPWLRCAGSCEPALLRVGLSMLIAWATGLVWGARLLPGRGSKLPLRGPFRQHACLDASPTPYTSTPSLPNHAHVASRSPRRASLGRVDHASALFLQTAQGTKSSPCLHAGRHRVLHAAQEPPSDYSNALDCKVANTNESSCPTTTPAPAALPSLLARWQRAPRVAVLSSPPYSYRH
jgi:hypothetical protein